MPKKAITITLEIQNEARKAFNAVGGEETAFSLFMSGFMAGGKWMNALVENENIIFGNIRIAKSKSNKSKVYLFYDNGTEHEGGEFSREKFTNHIEKFYQENF